MTLVATSLQKEKHLHTCFPWQTTWPLQAQLYLLA